MVGRAPNKLTRHWNRRTNVAGRRAGFRRAGPLFVIFAAYCSIAALCGSGTPLQAKEKPATTYTIHLPPQPDFSQVDWLVGEWSGKTTGRDLQGEIHLSAAYDLDKRVMIFREMISLPATRTIPAASETWMGVLTVARPGAGFILRTFSSTGFVTRYRVTVEGAEIHFNPDGGDQSPPGWLFRRIITRTNADELTETVQGAPPQKTFFDYYSARLLKTKPPAVKLREGLARGTNSGVKLWAAANRP